MKKITDLNYYELLNLNEDAATGDIHKAYLIAVSAYSKNSLATHSILSEEERDDMMKKIESAYTALIDKNNKSSCGERASKDGIDKSISRPDKDNNARGKEKESEFKLTDSTIFGGDHFKNIREMRGVTLDEISRKTKIKVSYLRAIEEDDFGVLPQEVFVRGFLKAYAKCLGLDPDIVSRNYKFKKNEL